MQDFKNIVVFGATGAIGSALINLLKVHYPQANIHAVSRTLNYDSIDIIQHKVDYNDELMIEALAADIAKNTPIDLVIIAIGLLHEGSIMPEKSLKEISAKKLHRLYEVNTILPAIIMKHLMPKLHHKKHSVIAALSARVGSISDNRLGGWYAYRASKAALNMIVKSAAIEIARYNQQAIIVTLHPGTVDSPLSQPFQRSIQKNKIFTPEKSARYLINQINQLTFEDSGKCFAWDGQEIAP